MYPPLEGQENFVELSDMDDTMSDISQLSGYSSTERSTDFQFDNNPQSFAGEQTAHDTDAAHDTDVGTSSKKNSDLEADVSFEPSAVSVFSQKTNPSQSN